MERIYKIDGFKVRVNSVDGRIVVEDVDLGHVRAWEEVGLAGLCGDFDGSFTSREQAEKVCEELEDFFKIINEEEIDEDWIP